MGVGGYAIEFRMHQQEQMVLLIAAWDRGQKWQCEECSMRLTSQPRYSSHHPAAGAHYHANAIGRPIDPLSLEHSSDMHAAVPEHVKGVLSMGAPPGAGLTECLQNSPASNGFAREIAHGGQRL
ncbi:hypothetical protein FIBSPDRAFT_956756 [Athelia psychrophila]|uniref:Uncharacterized protein n=1 Tax=Athelia psychrophila TaxID=1759441 RepID=A0A166GG55_9AGAM|nr:hypothetical protein FIBSPDRAFT_956756 [Fibularhizoctonia sp. CBS 109695]